MNLFQKKQQNWTKKIDEMQSLLREAEDESKKAAAQEEILVNQLNEKFECTSLDEAKELYSALLTEKEEAEKEIEEKTNILYEKMVADGLIK